MKRSKLELAFSIRFFFAILSFGICFNAYQASAQEPSSKKTVVQLGAITSSGGPAKEISSAWLSGVQIAIDSLAKKGITVVLRTEDGESRASKTANAYQKLVEESKVQGIIGGSLDYLLERLVPEVRRYRIPVISPSVSPDVLSDRARTSPLISTAGYSLVSSAAAFDLFFKNHLTRTYAIVSGDSTTEAEWSKQFRAAAERAGSERVYSSQVNYKNYSQQLEKCAFEMVKKRPDVLFLALDKTGIHLLARELFRKEVDLLMISGPELERAFDFAKSAKHYPTAFSLAPDYDAKEFYSDYYMRFNVKPPLHASAGYDSAILMVEAILNKKKVGEIVSPMTIGRRKMTLRTQEDGFFVEYKPRSNQSE